jgi:hypothetical protein
MKRVESGPIPSFILPPSSFPARKPESKRGTILFYSLLTFQAVYEKLFESPEPVCQHKKCLW